MWIITNLFQKNKREDNRSEVAESFQNSFENDNSIEMAIDVADLAIEKFIDSDVVNGVPVVGLLNSAYKVLSIICFPVLKTSFPSIGNRIFYN